MAAYSNFRSSTQIESEREELREARKKVLEKAKHDYERSERQREKARQAGEGTWMLQSVADRINKEEKAFGKVKKKKKEKKKKKKHKKEKKRKRQSSSSGTDSSDEEASWVEKSSEPTEARPTAGPSLQRDSWMDGPLVTDFLPTVTREELRERKRGEEEKKKAETVNLLEQPGQHVRELNPYWKDGGTGVPENAPKASAPVAAGDGGLSWLRKAYERCKQQAKDEGKSLEEVAAERYGSLEKLEAMLSEAEKASGKQRGSGRGQHFHRDDRSRRRSRSPTHQQETHAERDRRRENSGVGDGGDRTRDRDRGRSERENRDCEDRERDRRDGNGRERDRGPTERERSDRHDRDVRDSLWSRDRLSEKRRFIQPDDDNGLELVRKRPTFLQPGEDGDRFKQTNSNSLTSSMKGRFAKPAESDEDDSYVSRRHEHLRDRGGREGSDRNSKRDGGSGWKKPEYRKEEPPERRTKHSPKEERHKKRSSVSSHSDSGSSTSSDSEGSEEEKEEEPEKEAEPVPVKILSEDEMNSLGAKILRAEIMGDDKLATQLKEQLEQARKAKEAAPRSQASKDTATKVKDKEDSVVVLTRTGRDGMVRPLPEQEFDSDKRGKKRRRQNVTTHDRGGERTQYFDDDDRHDLKTLVHMEKLGTAEDQNAMFARLAGRSTEQTNDDFQVDDMFVSKAARQQSGAMNEEKERSKAIFEHRKVATAMEKCHFCFNKVPKHLIIAIGSKVYLSLPAHRSLTVGHCLIVPMQHTPAATALDEDVWQEIQAFRKQLVQMFAAQDQDAVFMETSMRLRHFPHMCVECIPLEREIGDMAPIYFKKAMLDAGPEWNSNKKVVDLSKKDIRRSVPKGFPYFSVDFGLQGGYAHVIEEENTFAPYFGREIVGGMIDAEPGLWRKPHREGFEDQRQKVLEFEKMWKPYDITS